VPLLARAGGVCRDLREVAALELIQGRAVCPHLRQGWVAGREAWEEL